MKDAIERSLRESIAVKEALLAGGVSAIARAAEIITKAMADGRKLLLFGNGGSAADAQHLASEFVNRLTQERRPLPALALTTDPSVVTSIANDRSFDLVFSRQLEAHARAGDVALAISTSGNSANVLAAVAAAKRLGVVTIALTGPEGGRLKAAADHCICAPGASPQRIQEAHITIGHILCELVEESVLNATGHEPPHPQ